MWRSELARYGMFVSYMYWFLLNSQVTIKGTVFSYNVWPKSYLIGKKNLKDLLQAQKGVINCDPDNEIENMAKLKEFMIQLQTFTSKICF